MASGEAVKDAAEQGGDRLVALIENLPGYLWVAVAVWFLILFKDPLRNQLIPRLTGFEGFGLKLDFNEAREAIDAAVAVAEKHPNWQVKVPEADRECAARRAARMQSVLQGAHILWVDDVPANNINEQRMFRQLGMSVTFAISTDEALTMLARNPAGFDVVLSDMARMEDGRPNPRAGIDCLKRYLAARDTLPVIFYIGVPDPTKGTPPGAFGLTHRPDELLHLVIDALERQRG